MRPRLIGIALICVSAALAAQSTRTYKARLSPVPIDLSMQATVAGSGSVTATRTGTRLTITGTFEGLRSPATIAQLHKSPVAGVRGPVVADLTVARGTNGSLSGTVDLTPALQQDLDKGRLYVQLHSERAPDGNLWGWLFAPESKK